jgi:Zn finger protein HypA/HybF involved in hydrogenase expression
LHASDRRVEKYRANLHISLQGMRDTFDRAETISDHEVAKPRCPKCGSKKVSVVPGRVNVVTSKKS